MLYSTYQSQRDLTAPLTAWASLTAQVFDALPPWLTAMPQARLLRAGTELVARARLRHDRPAFGIEQVATADGPRAVHETVVASSAFGDLLHFEKDTDAPGPTVLVVAALAGHFSTLLRPTVRRLLADHDVFVTDWRNARDVPVAAGPFGFDDYVADLMGFIRRAGPGAHVVAVCQPCPAALAAVALMAEDGEAAVPRTLTLMAGPVDTRVSPTEVDDLATRLPLSWFEDWAITTVPARYRGGGRRVYPGFVQLAGFMGMHPERHLDAHLELFADLVAGDAEAARVTTDFYDEYLAVLDVAAEFYLDTIDRVFQRHLLGKGELTWRGRPVRPAAITTTGLLTVEGGRDDICGLGQTRAAHDLCPSVPRRHHHVEPDAGHYGVFSGTAWEGRIAPVVADFIAAS